MSHVPNAPEHALRTHLVTGADFGEVGESESFTKRAQARESLAITLFLQAEHCTNLSINYEDGRHMNDCTWRRGEQKAEQEHHGTRTFASHLLESENSKFSVSVGFRVSRNVNVATLPVRRKRGNVTSTTRRSQRKRLKPWETNTGGFLEGCEGPKWADSTSSLGEESGLGAQLRATSGGCAVRARLKKVQMHCGSGTVFETVLKTEPETGDSSFFRADH